MKYFPNVLFSLLLLSIAFILLKCDWSRCRDCGIPVLQINGLSHEFYLDGNEFYFNEFEFNLQLETEKISYGNFEGWSILPSAYATSPPPPDINPEILAFHFTSNYQYDSLHVAGSLLDDIFEVSEYNYPIVDFPFKPYNFTLGVSLLQPPDSTSNHTFTVSIELPDSVFYETTLKEVTLIR